MKSLKSEMKRILRANAIGNAENVSAAFRQRGADEFAECLYTIRA
jgi:hypothetical protein